MAILRSRALYLATNSIVTVISAYCCYSFIVCSGHDLKLGYDEKRVERGSSGMWV